MEHRENTCPCCPRHCPLSAPGCEKGENYARTGEVSLERGGHEHRRGRHQMPDLNSTAGLLGACGHALHHRETGRDEPFAALSETEREELDRLLRKLLNSWGESEHGR
ncbi:MAG: hypothetical protein ACI3W8_00075 [Oscillospiraceae bacterium]